jgi:hypothetical protein
LRWGRRGCFVEWLIVIFIYIKSFSSVTRFWLLKISELSF